MKGATITTLDAAAEALRQVPDQHERDKALNFLIIFAMRRFGKDNVTAHIKESFMLDSYITSSELYQEILRRGKQRIAQRALEGRFGALAEDVIAALAEADEATLEDLVAHVLRIVTGHEHCDTLRGLSAF